MADPITLEISTVGAYPTFGQIIRYEINSLTDKNDFLLRAKKFVSPRKDLVTNGHLHLDFPESVMSKDAISEFNACKELHSLTCNPGTIIYTYDAQKTLRFLRASLYRNCFDTNTKKLPDGVRIIDLKAMTNTVNTMIGNPMDSVNNYYSISSSKEYLHYAKGQVHKTATGTLVNHLRKNNSGVFEYFSEISNPDTLLSKITNFHTFDNYTKDSKPFLFLDVSKIGVTQRVLFPIAVDHTSANILYAFDLKSSLKAFKDNDIDEISLGINNDSTSIKIHKINIENSPLIFPLDYFDDTVIDLSEEYSGYEDKASALQSMPEVISSVHQASFEYKPMETIDVYTQWMQDEYLNDDKKTLNIIRGYIEKNEWGFNLDAFDKRIHELIKRLRYLYYPTSLTKIQRKDIDHLLNNSFYSRESELAACERPLSKIAKVQEKYPYDTIIKTLQNIYAV